MVRAFLIAAAVLVALVGFGGALVAPFQGPAGPGGSGGGGGADPAIEATLSAIDLNLSKLGGSLVAEVSAVDSNEDSSYVGAQLRAKGSSKLRIDRPAGMYVHNEVEFNIAVPGGPTYGMRWDDMSGTSIRGAAQRIGLVDQRAILKLARTFQSSLLVGSQQTINGVTANKLSNSSFSLYVDASAPGRILRASFSDGDVVLQGDFGGWTQCHTDGGELPTTWLATNSLVDGATVYRQIAYTLSNLSFGETIADSVFATAGLPDSLLGN